MDRNKKQHIDSLWKNTRIWQYVHLLADNKIIEAQKLFEIIPQEYKGTAIEVNMLNYETKECCKKLLKEFSNWEEYINYIKTFDDSVNDVLYQLDLFDSYMARSLKDE